MFKSLKQLFSPRADSTLVNDICLTSEYDELSDKHLGRLYKCRHNLSQQSYAVVSKAIERCGNKYPLFATLLIRQHIEHKYPLIRTFDRIYKAFSIVGANDKQQYLKLPILLFEYNVLNAMFIESNYDIPSFYKVLEMDDMLSTIVAESINVDARIVGEICTDCIIDVEAYSLFNPSYAIFFCNQSTLPQLSKRFSDSDRDIFLQPLQGSFEGIRKGRGSSVVEYFRILEMLIVATLVNDEILIDRDAFAVFVFEEIMEMNASQYKISSIHILSRIHSIFTNASNIGKDVHHVEYLYNLLLMSGKI